MWSPGGIKPQDHHSLGRCGSAQSDTGYDKSYRTTSLQCRVATFLSVFHQVGYRPLRRLPSPALRGPGNVSVIAGIVFRGPQLGFPCCHPGVSGGTFQGSLRFIPQFRHARNTLPWGGCLGPMKMDENSIPSKQDRSGLAVGV